MARTQTDEVKQVWDYFVRYLAGDKFLDDEFNGKLLGQYIEDHCDGLITPENLFKGMHDPSINCHLHLRGQSLTAKEISNRAAAEAAEKKRQAIAAQAERIVLDWIRDTCPLGILIDGPRGRDLYPASQEKIIAFIQRNYAGQPLTAEMLTAAVETLDHNLDWFSSNPEDCVFRGPKPEKKLSDQARIDGGLQRDPNSVRDHANDGKWKSPAQIAEDAKKFLKKKGMKDEQEAEWQAKAEQMSVTNRLGKFDYAKTAELRQIFAHNPDRSVNWKVTHEWRSKAADQIERTKNN